MDPKLGNHPSPDSLKRKRGDLEEDDTPDNEREVLLGKKTKPKSDELSPTKATPDTADIAAAIIDAGSSHTHRPPTIATSDATGTETNTAATAMATGSIPPKPTLQILPRELRDLIYDFVAATEERIVLGRRMTEARRKSYETETHYESFKGAIALHPLSMTCHQFLDEFREVHIAASEPSWTLVVNNFDLQQLHDFSAFIQSGQYIKVAETNFHEVEGGLLEDWLHQAPSYNFNVSVRFQMDSHVYESADELHRHLINHEGDAPASLASPGTSRRWLGVADITTQYVPRTSAPVDESKGMTLAQARKVRSMFEHVAYTIFEVMDEMERCGERIFGGQALADSFGYMEWCWFEPFCDAVSRMEDAVEDGDEAST